METSGSSGTSMIGLSAVLPPASSSVTGVMRLLSTRPGAGGIAVVSRVQSP